MTWKHVFIVAMGLGAACFGAWISIAKPDGVGGPMIISLGSNLITGALAHAGHGMMMPKKNGGPGDSGGVPSAYIPSNGSMPNALR